MSALTEQDVLSSLHAAVQPRWLNECIRHLEATTGFSRQPRQAQLQLVLQQLLAADLNLAGGAALPLNVQARRCVKRRDRTLPRTIPAT
jgi:hypothetical protein